MLARSTACRHGLGRASTNATSISSSRLGIDLVDQHLAG
jgi:hypothetical protein